MQAAVKINNVSIFYGNVCALSNINLTVQEKDFIAVMGPNGGGKSTLLRVILGLLKPSKGSVKIFGFQPGKTDTVLGYVPQYSKFDRNFPISVGEVILSGRLRNNNRLFHRYSENDTAIVKGIMKSLDIYDIFNRQMGQLSGGQLQRVLIARALSVEPSILVLDEPTASLDAGFKTQIYDILKKLNKKMTIILVTHDLGAVSTHIKNLACLNKELYYHGEPELTVDTIEKVYGCPVDLIAHGVPHRVLEKHKGEKEC